MDALLCKHRKEASFLRTELGLEPDDLSDPFQPKLFRDSKLWRQDNCSQTARTRQEKLGETAVYG